MVPSYLLSFISLSLEVLIRESIITPFKSKYYIKVYLVRSDSIWAKYYALDDVAHNVVT